MKLNKVVAAAGAATIMGLATAGVASAAQDSNSTLVQKLSKRFNVSESDVQKVFDEEKQERKASMEQRYEERLNQAVKDGKLTSEQKNKLLAKHKELVSQMESKRDSMRAERRDFDQKSESERQQLMEQRKSEVQKQREEIEAWEKANNIPSGYLGVGMRHGHGGPGGPQ